MKKEDVITKIAQAHLGIETLEDRHSDSLDFHEISVWALKKALTDAYEAGQKSINSSVRD